MKKVYAMVALGIMICLGTGPAMAQEIVYPPVGCGHCAARIAPAEWFNCCRGGSYKFPVPPQYTYHWPGIYSQQSMTRYASPFRFPPLEQPKPRPAVLKGEAVAGLVAEPAPIRLTATGPVRTKVGTSRPPTRPEPMSSRIKRKYRLR